jgi:hypothetical protein
MIASHSTNTTSNCSRWYTEDLPSALTGIKRPVTFGSTGVHFLTHLFAVFTSHFGAFSCRARLDRTGGAFVYGVAGDRLSRIVAPVAWHRWAGTLISPLL